MDGKQLGPAELVRTAQIILAALAMGVVFFAAVVLFAFNPPGNQNPGMMLGPVMALIAGLALALRFVVPGIIIRATCQRIAGGAWKPSDLSEAKPGNLEVGSPEWEQPDRDTAQLLPAYLTKTIVGAALLEGAALANLIAYMLEGQLYSIVLSGVLVVIMLGAFPTRHALDEWIEQQKRRVKELRSMSGTGGI